MRDIKYYLIENNLSLEKGKKDLRFVIPLSMEFLGKYGWHTYAINALFKNERMKERFGFWHDGNPGEYLHYLVVYNNSFIEACEREHFLNLAFAFTPKHDYKIIRKYTYKVKKVDDDLFLNIMKELKRKQELLNVF